MDMLILVLSILAIALMFILFCLLLVYLLDSERKSSDLERGSFTLAEHDGEEERSLLSTEQTVGETPSFPPTTPALEDERLFLLTESNLRMYQTILGPAPGEDRRSGVLNGSESEESSQSSTNSDSSEDSDQDGGDHCGNGIWSWV